MKRTNADPIARTLTASGAPFEMAEIEIRGARTRVWKHAPQELRSVLQASTRNGDRPFLVYGDERVNYAEHYRQCAVLARAFVEVWGISKGERVAIAMRNYPEWSVVFWATVAIGAVAVPLNAWMTGAELGQCMADSGSRLLVADEERFERLRACVSDLRLAGTIVVRATKPVPSDAVTWQGIVAESASPPLPEAVVADDDDATILYTGGTTGRPKGAVGTHRNICTNLMSIGYNQARHRLRSGVALSPASPPPSQRCNLLSVPLFSVSGCYNSLVGSLHAGSKVVLMHRWDPEQALQLIERERVTIFGGVPAMAWQVIESPAFNRYDLSSVERISYGAAPASPELEMRLRTMLPRAVSSFGYGLTETSAVVCQNIGEDYRIKPESVGIPVPVCDVRIVDATGNDTPPGAAGEIWVKGPNVVKGYWNNPEATAMGFQDGWLKTGDVGRFDEDGFLYILDRIKDVLIRGGENIYCIEVENALYSHSAVLDAAVIGIPHRILGEEVGAVVQLRPGARVDEDALKRHVAQRLAAFKVPVRIAIQAHPLPRNPAGKILKRELRTYFA